MVIRPSAFLGKVLDSAFSSTQIAIDRNCEFGPVTVSHFAKSILWLIQKGRRSGRYNVTGSEKYRASDIASQICRILASQNVIPGQRFSGLIQEIGQLDQVKVFNRGAEITVVTEVEDLNRCLSNIVTSQAAQKLDKSPKKPVRRRWSKPSKLQKHATGFAA